MHTGEMEVRGDRIGGLAVHIGARVAAAAVGGEILVSSTVKDLLAGSGLTFTNRGEHTLKGVPGTWHLFAPRLERPPQRRPPLAKGSCRGPYSPGRNAARSAPGSAPGSVRFHEILDPCRET